MAIGTYTRFRDYSQFQSDNPDTDLNGSDLDTDFDRIKTFSDDASAAIADVRRDDGQLKNASVGLDQIKSELVPFLNKAVTFRGDWATATAYAVNDFVSESSSNYVCLVAHTSGTFATDLAADKWQLVSTTGSTGATGPGYTATSTTSIAIGTGSKSFTTQGGLAYTVGARVRVASQNTTTAWMEGLVSAYSGTTLTVEVALTSGSGTKSDWNINLAGEPSTSATPGHIFGLTLSNDGTLPNTILDIASGQCTASDVATTIALGSAITKDITDSWAAGDAGGGMGVGLTVAASTWYHVFAIMNDGVADVYFDTDVDGANAPSGTTAVRRIGSFKTDSSSHIVTFIQDGDYFHWQAAVADVSAASSGTSAVSRTLSVPIGVRVRALFRGGAKNTSNSTSELVIFSDLSLTDPGAPAAGSSDTANIGTSTGNTGQGFGRFEIFTNTSAQVRSRQVDGSATSTLYIITLGWVDRRGRDD